MRHPLYFLVLERHRVVRSQLSQSLCCSGHWSKDLWCPLPSALHSPSPSPPLSSFFSLHPPFVAGHSSHPPRQASSEEEWSTRGFIRKPRYALYAKPQTSAVACLIRLVLSLAGHSICFDAISFRLFSPPREYVPACWYGHSFHFQAIFLKFIECCKWVDF